LPGVNIKNNSAIVVIGIVSDQILKNFIVSARKQTNFEMIELPFSVLIIYLQIKIIFND